ncbi:MAG: FAD-binding protein, partial [Atopobium sp.]|nr:FAD-binding protein [Atopobium sp.]
MSLFNAYVSLSGALDATIKQDEPLSHHTSFRIGGKASLFAAVHSHVALVRVLEVLAANRVDWVLLGKGSNILVSDEGYNGCVIVLDDELSTISVGENNLITAGAGALTARVCNEAMKAGLSGLEMCAGIPGTIGGALSMNAGTRHDWIGKAVRDCVVLKPGKGLVRYDASEIEWGYRYTTFAPDEIILEATFALTPSNRPKVALG